MGRKMLIAIVVVLAAILVVAVNYSINESPDMDSTELSVSTEGPIKLSALVEDIESASYYEGYDNETLSWMKSLGDMEVFSGNGMFVVMNSVDAGKLKSEYVCDASITQDFRCKVLERHSLGDVEYPKDVLLVKDIEYLRENITYYDV